MSCFSLLNDDDDDDDDDDNNNIVKWKLKFYNRWKLLATLCHIYINRFSIHKF